MRAPGPTPRGARERLRYSACRYPAYSANARCSNGNEVGTDYRYDIQLLRLNQNQGNSNGWFGATSSALTSVNVNGYPGDSDLNNYISFATHKQFRRFKSCSYDSRTFTVPGMWAFGGESGCPYYQFKDGSRYVAAVHRGGPTGCSETGVRMSSDFINWIGSGSWTAPPAHCLVVRYFLDIWGGYTGPLQGIGYTSPFTTGSLSISQGSTFVARATVYNVGTAGSTGTRIFWYASLSSTSLMSPIYLGASSTLAIGARGRMRYTNTLRVTWTGYRYAVGRPGALPQAISTHHPAHQVHHPVMVLFRLMHRRVVGHHLT